MRRIYFLLLLFPLLILFLPRILSTPSGNTLLIEMINRSIPGMVTAESIELSWFSGLEARHLQLFDSQGEPLLTADAIAIDLSLSELLLRRYTPIKEGALANVNAILVVDESGNSNFDTALSKQAEPLNDPLPPIVIDRLSGSWNWPARWSCSGHVNGAAIKSDLQIGDPTRLNVSVDQLPIELIDWVSAFAGYTTGNAFQQLLGPTLSLNVNGDELVITSQRLKGRCKWDAITPASITLAAPAQFTYNATQEALEVVMPHFPLTLAEPATMNIGINNWLFSLESWTSSSFALEARVNGSRWLLEGLETSFSVPQLNLTIEKEEAISLTAQMDAYEEMGDSKIELAARWEEAQWGINLETAGFPLMVIDKMLDSHLQLTHWLGDTLDLKIHGEAGGRLIIGVHSPNLTLPNLHFDMTETLTLSSPVTASWLLPTVSLYNVAIDAPSLIDFSIKELCLPLQLDRLWQDGMINATIKNETAIPLHIGRGRIIVENGELAITGPTLSQAHCELHCSLKNESDTIAGVLGRQSSCSMVAKLSPTRSDFRLQLVGDHSLLQCKGRYANAAFELLSPAQIAFRMTPQLLQRFQLNPENWLVAPAAVELSVAPFTTKGTMEEWKLSGTAQVKGMTVTSSGQRETLKKLFASWEYNQNKWKVRVNGTTEKEGTIKGHFSYKLPISYKGSIELAHFPTAFFSMHPRLRQLPLLMGSEVNSTASVALTNESGQFNLDISSEGLNVGAEGTLSNGVFKTKSGSALQMQITPERFNALYTLMGVDTPLMLRDAATLELTIKELETRWKGISRNSRLHASGSITPFVVTHQGETLALERIDGTFDSDSMGQKSTLTIVATSDDNGKPLVINGTIEDLLSYDGNFNHESLSLALDLRITNGSAPLLSSLFLPHLPLLPTKLEALVGTPFDLNFDANLKKMHGRVAFSLTGERGKATFLAKLAGDRLMLEAPAVAEVAGTPLLGRVVLSEVLPLFKGVQSSEHPIKITIDPDGFSLPIDHLELAGVEIKKGTIDIGKVQLTHSGPLKTVMGLLGAPDAGELLLWATPLYFSLDQGKISIERVDILIDNHYPIACWGTVDLPHDTVSLIIGIRAPALSKALKINALKSDQMLQVPLKGSIENPSIDKAKVAARITALVAQAEGATGLVLGTVLNIASGTFDEEKAPPPTTSPLPWDDSSPPTPSKKERKKNVESIEKGAKTMLKKLFR